MIGKISKGNGFLGVLKYTLDEEKGHYLTSNLDTSNGITAKNFALQFHSTRALNKRVKKPVFHMAVSFAPGEKIDDSKMVKVGEEFMKKMGFDLEGEKSHLYTIVRHTDTSHPHMHIIASKINISGGVWNDSKDFERANNVARELEKKYGLKQVTTEKKEIVSESAKEINKSERIRRNMPEYVSPRRYLQTNIDKAMKSIGGGKTSFKSFVIALKNQGIDLNINASNDLKRVNGISYSLNKNGENIIYKGSALGKKYSWNSLINNVEFDYKKDKELLKSIVQNSRFNKVSGLSNPKKEEIIKTFKKQLNEYSTEKNVNIFNKDYRFSRLSFNDKQLTYLSNLNDEWSHKIYKNDPLKYFENAYKKQRYNDHSKGINEYFSLDSEEKITHKKLSNDLKLSLSNHLKKHMENEGFSFSYDLQMKTQSLRLSGKDHKELVQHLREWDKGKYTLNPMDYFFEKYSVHKEYFENSLLNKLDKLDRNYGLNTTSSFKAIKEIAEETNHDYRVPAAVLKYEESVKNGQVLNVVEFVRDSVQKRESDTTIPKENHEIVHVSDNILEDFFKDFAKGLKSDGGGDQYKEEQTKRKRRKRRIQ